MDRNLPIKALAFIITWNMELDPLIVLLAGRSIWRKIISGVRSAKMTALTRYCHLVRTDMF